MPTVPFQQFLESLHKQFPNLKQYDETRLFSLLMQAGVNVEFEIDNDGNTMISHGEISGDSKSKLGQL
ncbi:MAG TPA: hypothetical protein VJB38_05025 [Bacteroidota bacterium]|nr:hypothetical protein [Bacteroidota bacterium]